MGGRGSNSGMNPMAVPYDKWGATIDEYRPIEKKNAEGMVTERIYDTEQWDYREVVEPVTKKQALATIEDWKNSGTGTYGDEDTAIYVVYGEQGQNKSKLLDLSEVKKFPKRNIIGISISTPDDEMVWGGEYVNGQFSPYRLWTEDGYSGATNSYRWYKPTSITKKRIREYVTQTKDGRYKWNRETIRQSTPKQI